MKHYNPGSRKQKIILYYALAVVLPGIILGYMAYRGIRNDQALREKENLKRLEMNSQDFFSEIDSSFVQFIEAKTTYSIPAGKDSSDPSVLSLFVEDTSGSKRLIIHQLLYLPDEFLDIMPRLPDSPARLKEGLRLEFVECSYPDALRFYQDIILKTTNPEEQIQALVASARLYNKMSQPDKAKSIYYDMREDYPGRLLNKQIPLGLLASLEIMKIEKAGGVNDEMINNSRRYLELLLYPPGEYGKDQFDMFYQSFKDIYTGNDHVTDSLLAQLDVRSKRTDFIIRILRQPDLLLSNSNNRFRSDKNGLSVIPINSAELYGVLITSNKPDGSQTDVVIDFPVYLNSIFGSLINKMKKGSSFSIKVEDNKGRLIFSNGLKDVASYLTFPFPDYLPQLNLLLSENKPGFLATLFKTGSGIYLFVFILIALFMLLGFAFIIYTLNVELRLNKLKSEFISNVSHELKSPLTSIRMMTEMLHQNRVETEERKSAYYSAMLEESEHLSHLIDNILDFSRMDEDRKKYSFADLDLNELLDRFLESIRERIAESGFKIRFDHPEKVPLIKGDRDAILQVIYNLADNAIKFSGTSRQIDFTLVSENDKLIFCVKDYGIGIPGKDLEKVFDRFYRGTEPQRSGIRGSGIGLTIVKQIVEAHGGTIEVESEVGKGSMVTVRLPLC